MFFAHIRRTSSQNGHRSTNQDSPVTDCLNLFETRVPVHDAQIIIALNYSVNKIQLKIRPAWVVEPRKSSVRPDRDDGKPPVLQAFDPIVGQRSRSSAVPPYQAITDGQFKLPVALFEKGHPALEIPR